jgi:hypothetical protein
MGGKVGVGELAFARADTGEVEGSSLGRSRRAASLCPSPPTNVTASTFTVAGYRLRTAQ